MKIDLLKFVDDNKKIKDLEDEADFKKELNKLIAKIIEGGEKFHTDSDELVNKLKLKFKKINYIDGRNSFGWVVQKACKYEIKLTKENIKRVQEYLDEE